MPRYWPISPVCLLPTCLIAIVKSCSSKNVGATYINSDLTSACSTPSRGRSSCPASLSIWSDRKRTGGGGSLFSQQQQPSDAGERLNRLCVQRAGQRSRSHSNRECQRIIAHFLTGILVALAMFQLPQADHCFASSRASTVRILVAEHRAYASKIQHCSKCFALSCRYGRDCVHHYFQHGCSHSC